MDSNKEVRITAISEGIPEGPEIESAGDCFECGGPTYRDDNGRLWCMNSPACGPSVTARRSILGY